jgi:hypothetical protein
LAPAVAARVPGGRARPLLGIGITDNETRPDMRYVTEALIIATAAMGALLLTTEIGPSLPHLLAEGNNWPMLFPK